MRKTVDLSTRQLPMPHAPIPSFSRRLSTVDTAEGAGILDLFEPGCACTVQWILCQISAACTAQLYMNGQPFGVALEVSANAIIRFAGTLLPNNCKLSLFVSESVTVAYEVVWTKDIRSELIQDDTSIFQTSSGTISGTVSVSNFPAVQPISAAALPLPTGAAQDGTDNTGVAQPSGGTGIRGWLSAIYKALTGTLTAAISGAVAVTGTFWQATQPVSAASGFFPVAVQGTIAADAQTIVAAGTINGAMQTNTSGCRGVVVHIRLGTVSGTSPTFTAGLQYSPDGGVTWRAWISVGGLIAVASTSYYTVTLYPTVSATVPAGAGSSQVNGGLPKFWRMQYGTGGTGISIQIAEVDYTYMV